MKKILSFTALTAVLTLTCWMSGSRTALATESCEAMHLKRCSPRGLLAPCTYADGSPGQCTCVGKWDCLL
jgi:hypothetical protein